MLLSLRLRRERERERSDCFFYCNWKQSSRRRSAARTQRSTFIILSILGLRLEFHNEYLNFGAANEYADCFFSSTFLWTTPIFRRLTPNSHLQFRKNKVAENRKSARQKSQLYFHVYVCVRSTRNSNAASCNPFPFCANYWSVKIKIQPSANTIHSNYVLQASNSSSSRIQNEINFSTNPSN